MHDTLFMNFETLKEITGNPNLNPADWHQHKNGGGWVYKDVFIEENPEIYIGPKAIVWGGTIRKSNFAFKCEMHGGVMWGGVMWGGVMWGGEMRGGEMRGGVMRGGVMWGGVMWGGEMHGGVMWGGVMWGGVMRGGEMRGGVMWGGVMRGGVMWGGEMRGGVMWGGVMWGGEMLEGTWETTPLFIAGSKHSLSNAKPGYIQIGCQLHTFAHWQKHVRGIAKIHGYNKAEQDEYAAYVELFIKLGK